MRITDIPFGTTSQVAAAGGAHRSHTTKGAQLFIVD